MIICLFWALGGCSSSDGLSIGARCDSDSQCESAFCETGPWRPALCAFPNADLDGDELDAVAERAAGTDSQRADTDDDGIADKVEVGDNPAAPKDRDGDGKPDALEHDFKDSDGDCLADPDDQSNDVPASKEALAAIFCNIGVCAGHAPRATCEGVIGQVTCEVIGVPDYEPEGERRCDKRDNDCDGETDEGLEGLAGAACGASGVCVGAPTSRCIGGQWICNLSGIADYETVEKSCDGVDNDCDGKTDEAPLCDDGLPCTIDACVGGKGCQHTPSGQRCNDGNPCTIDLCELPNGCRSLPHIGTCNDSNPCTTGESCSNGVCENGTATICDDGNSCTLDTCAKDSGCIGVALSEGTACKPIDACAQAGTCVAGKCKGHSAVVCNDDNPCTADSCDSEAGGCVHLANEGACNDGNPCTENDSCLAKLCMGVPLPSCCTANTDCSDQNPCTQDSCLGGACKNAASGLDACDDGNVCTSGEACADGLCVGGIWDVCDDSDACTLDICDNKTAAASCTHASLPDGANCDDGDVCNGFGACGQGTCKVGLALDCDDGNPCTKDVCHPLKGCTHAAHKGDCDDGNACTMADVCASGACVGVALQCGDLNPCTIDTCKVELGCQYLPVAGSCDDGSACTTGDACSEGACKGTDTNCDDGKPCTIDTCSKIGVCEHDDKPTEATGCDDGNACTLGDLCKSGVCSAGVSIDCQDGNTCTNDTCDKVSGLCKYTFRTGSCVTATGCTSDASCKLGLCQGTPIANCCKLNGNCNDGNPCSIDSCDKSTGQCSHAPVSGLGCGDGSKCTVGDVCVGGLCKGAAYLGCDDDKPCTLDYCLSQTGCHHLLTVTGLCSDDDPCNGIEHCSVGGCLPGVAPDCDDGKPCTLDLCEKAKGCVSAFKQPGTSCDDGSGCTTTDQCDGLGTCVGTPTKGAGCCTSDAACDDGYACTLDKCLTALARCTHTPLTCNSNQQCTAGWCETGSCKAASRCLAPEVYAESFEQDQTPGWLLSSDAPPVSATVAWIPTKDGAAVDGSQVLHCPLAAGTFTARLPTMALSAGDWRLKMNVKLDKDGADCTQGGLYAKRDGTALPGGTLCKSSGAMVAVDLPLSVTHNGDVVELSMVWVGVAAKPTTTRGVWIDDVRIVAVPGGSGCACTP
ncbi:MAG: hypothetical protein KC502_06485 [Myxococcales bacterium]|nr:hypothetical protein [Myxococcales bacterium]